MADILKTYQKRLTNLSNRNKSLLLLGLSQKNFLDLHALDFLNNKPSFSIIENLIKGISKTLLCPQIDSRDKFANQVSPILKNIQRTDRFIQEENGAKNLFVGYPIVEGKLLDDTLIRCPLLFFPVEILLENGSWYLQMRENESMIFNKTFLLAYNFFNKTQFKEDFLDQNFEDEHWTKCRKDSTQFRTDLYKYLENNELEINFNSDNFTNTLHYFTKQGKSEFDLFHQTGRLKLQAQAVLGIFPQADSYLAPDYDFLLREAGTPTDELLPLFASGQAKINTENNIYPYSLDASQEKALQTIKSGQSIVVQGPPGTGKSQLICNLVADSIANGKTVLVVCQKKAALDVVNQRLSEKQVQHFTALVHDFQYDKKNIYKQLNEQIEKVYEKSEQKVSLESLHYEEGFLQANRQIEQQSRLLDEFKSALFDTSECGLSIKELYLTSDKNLSHISLPKVTDLTYNFRFDNAHQDFLQKLDLYEKYAENLEKFDYQWLDRVSFTKFENEDLEKIKEVIEEIVRVRKQLSIDYTIPKKENLNFNPQIAEKIEEKSKEIRLIVDKLANLDVLTYFQRILDKPNIDIKKIEKREKEILESLESEEIEKTLHWENLALYKEYLEDYIQNQKSFLKAIKWNLFAKEKRLLKTLAKDNHLILNKNNAELLIQKIDKRIIFEQKIGNYTIEGIDFLLSEDEYWLYTFYLSDLAECIEKKDFEFVFNNCKEAIILQHKANKLLKNLSGWGKYLKRLFLIHRPNTLEEFLKEETDEQKLNSYYQEIKTQTNLLLQNSTFLFEKYKIWKKYLTEKQIATLWEKPHLAEEWTTILVRDFELLCEFDELKASLTAQQVKIIEKLMLSVGTQTTAETLSVVEDPANRFTNILELPANCFSTIFSNSLRLAWIAHIERQHPILKAVSTPKFGQIEQSLQKAVTEIGRLSEEILLVRTYESACKALEYNRLKNIVSYRELKHQVNKKRNTWALRKLILNFRDEVFKLIPCWLCSPETVSAIFPMESQLFDLVIFDEASQCFAEKGIPAMYRGKQVVIVGDDKQLAPNDLYQIRWGEDLDEEDSSIALETESLLDLGKHFLPVTSLTGHYRSKSLDLIGFSNQYFYNNKLKLLPNYQEFIKNEPAISYLKVAGVWEKNTNLIEAQEVVKVIRQFLEKGKNDIGVITFNYKQQLLIQDLLEKEKIALPPSIFIKNIENVQGDERDIIIFSTTYAPDLAGRLKMQFGSLNLQGGENRMNVAVTRAKEQIVVISSIFPHQLNIEDLTHEGGKVFKKYLEYALEVSQGKYKADLQVLPKQNLEWYLKEKMRLAFSARTQTTAEVITNIPFADLGIASNTPFSEITLILTDDNLYYEALSIKESHVYLPLLLVQKGWTFQQFYSRNFWLSKDTFFNHK